MASLSSSARRKPEGCVNEHLSPAAPIVKLEGIVVFELFLAFPGLVHRLGATRTQQNQSGDEECKKSFHPDKKGLGAILQSYCIPGG